MFVNVVLLVWERYIQWCDSMGLTPENRRSCMPKLSDPPLQQRNDSKVSFCAAPVSAKNECTRHSNVISSSKTLR